MIQSAVDLVPVVILVSGVRPTVAYNFAGQYALNGRRTYDIQYMGPRSLALICMRLSSPVLRATRVRYRYIQYESIEMGIYSPSHARH